MHEPTPNTHRRLWFVAISGMALIVLVLVWPYLHQLLHPSSRTLDAEINCDISKNRCTAGSDQKISLAITSRPVQAMVPLTFAVTLHNVPAERVILNLQGVKMYMGLHQVELQPVGNQQWQGKMTLAICTTGEMLWRAQVIAQDNQQIITANFDFAAR